MRLQKRRRTLGSAVRVEILEDRRLLTLPNNLVIPLVPDLDQFGDQVVTVQSFDSPNRATMSIFDTGASAIRFSAEDQAFFGSEFSGAGPIPIKVPGGADAGGIGGQITGDVSQPGTISVDGITALSLSFDNAGFPQFGFQFGPTTASQPGIQAMVGTDSGSPDLPTITGTPLLVPSAQNPQGLAARVDMQGTSLDFSDVAPGLVLPFPDIHFVQPGSTLDVPAGVYDPVRLAMTPFGNENVAAPGDRISESTNWLLPGVAAAQGATTAADKSFLFDTGAQLSIISTDTAKALGLDLNSPQTTIDVQGVGGTETIPGYTLSSLTLPRTDGGTLEFTDAPVYVLDVAPGIDGIFGTNLLNVAHAFQFDPNAASGPSVSITYDINPDRNSAGNGSSGGGLDALLSSHNLKFLGGVVGGHQLPGFTPAAAATTTSLTVSAPSTPFATTITASAQVEDPGAPGVATPGTVAFLDGTTVLGTAPVAKGKAELPISNLAIGTHHLTARYQGSASLLGSTSSPVASTITPIVTTLSLDAPGTNPVVGQTVELRARLGATSSLSPSGLVTFRNGNDVLGTAPVSDGSAVLPIKASQAGLLNVTASYQGDSVFEGSMARPMSLNVSRAASRITVRTKYDPKHGTTQVRIEVDALAPGAGVPTGSIQVWEGSGKPKRLSLGNQVAILVEHGRGRPTRVAYAGDGSFTSSSWRR